ncbi:MAG TPA: hypothetical protein VF810_03530 [Patescibacteria group bacterium]
MSDQTMQTITEDIEKDLFDEIVRNLDQATITAEEAQSVAQEFFALLPLQDKKDLLDKLYKLSVDHTETRNLYLKFAKPIEENDRQQKLALMSQHIINGQLDHALAVAKGEIKNGR